MNIQKHLNYHDLKTRHREIRDNFPHSLSLRVHRALSWLNRAEQVHLPVGRLQRSLRKRHHRSPEFLRTKSLPKLPRPFNRFRRR